MKEKHKNLIIFLVLILILIIFLYFSVKKVFLVLTGLDKTVAVGTIGAATTIMVTVISVSLTKYFEHKAIVTKEHRNKKIPVMRNY